MVESKKTEEENERRIGRVKEIRLEQEAMDELTKSVGRFKRFSFFNSLNLKTLCKIKVITHIQDLISIPQARRHLKQVTRG